MIAGHINNLTLANIPIVNMPIYAVDLFMIISGFLMYYHAVLRKDTEPLETWSSYTYFIVRRFFRVAPAYYLMLIFWFLAAPALWEMSRSIGNGDRLSPMLFDDRSFENITSHLSFTFGVSPEYHYRTLLPDWSIGLEMQFYILFPLMFILMLRFGIIAASLALIAVSFLFWIAAPSYVSSFVFPTFLFLKINMFLSGMVLCAAMLNKEKTLLYTCFAFALARLPLSNEFGFPSMLFRMVLLGCVAALALKDHFPMPLPVHRFLHFISHQFGRGVFHILGELSYGAYLVHMLIIVPATFFTVGHLMEGEQGIALFALVFIVSLPIAYGLAWGVYRLVEKPGISAGKAIIAKMKSEPS